MSVSLTYSIVSMVNTKYVFLFLYALHGKRLVT